ncbi:hypothetical protein QUF80_00115 [Desulfococcaceae bacterium HSG8]|nr:hypothetical protein [Desulfococcaceae bacterium HSG8]
MTGHKDIQNPDDYTEKDYQEFEEKLFSPSASVAELEDICMTLAHLPTERAQGLLMKFRETARSQEVLWLDCAAEEGQYHYLSPQNDEESRDYLALKVMQELWDEIIELEVKHDQFKLEAEKEDIQYQAIESLIKEGKLEKEEGYGFHDANTITTSEMEDLAHQISVKEKIFDKIKESIKTDRYKDIDPMYMRNIHFG